MELQRDGAVGRAWGRVGEVDDHDAVEARHKMVAFHLQQIVVPVVLMDHELKFGRGPRDPESMYDARIAREGCVPTRPGSWHDLMNALVWATFPLAKRALHARQHGLVVPALPGESVRRPRELDALALLDEGGLVVTTDGALPALGERAAAEAQLVAELEAGRAKAFVFGHAIYEGIVLGRSAPLASVVCIACPRSSVADADRALAEVLADREKIVEPRAMLRLRVDERLVPR